MTDSDQDLSRIQQQAETLETSFKTLSLSTLAAENQPAISYAPYVRIEGNYFIFVSELSEHTQHLMARPCCSIMFIEDEEKSRNLFARERLLYDCAVTEEDRYSEAGLSILDKLEEEQGQTVSMLKQLADFKLFRLSPIKGRYVVGFGKAYNIDGQTRTFSHIGPDQIKKS